MDDHTDNPHQQCEKCTPDSSNPIQTLSRCPCHRNRRSASWRKRRIAEIPELAFCISEDESLSRLSATEAERLHRSNESETSSEFNVKYLGSIKAALDMDVLKHLAAQIANECSRQYMIVSDNELDPIERALKCEIQRSTPTGQQNDLRNNFSMKVYMQGDRPGDANNVPITISGMELVKFLLGDCPQFFRTSLSSLRTEEVTHLEFQATRRKAKETLTSVKAARERNSKKAPFDIKRHIKYLLEKRRRQKQRPFLKNLRDPKEGLFPKMSSLPITTINVFKGFLYASDISGKLITYNIGTHKIHNASTRQICSEGLQSVSIAPYSRHGICIYVAALDGVLRILRARTGCMKAEIRVSTPIHSMYTKFSHTFLGLSSGEIVIFHKRQMTIAGVLKVCDSIIASITGRFLYGIQKRRFLFVGAYDGKIYKIDLDKR
ncbi:hypothetical protein ACOME3_002649 [Neoechinorhynchus agilis]